MDSSPLGKLPAEPRNRIYRMVLLDEAPVKVQRKSVHERTALLQTCSQIRNEASGVFYGNTFHIICGSGIGKAGAGRLKTFESDLHSATKIMITFEISASILNDLKFAKKGVKGRQRGLRFRRRFPPDLLFWRHSFATLVAFLCEESLDLAKALSSAVKAGSLSRRQLNIINPITCRVGPNEEEYGNEMMYGLFKGLGMNEWDQIRAETTEKGMLERLLSL